MEGKFWREFNLNIFLVLISSPIVLARVQLCGVYLLECFIVLKATEDSTKEYQERFDQYAEELTKKRGT